MLVLRDDTLACLELLEEDRLALSSLITVEARSEDDELSEDDESSEELLAQESIRPKANAKIVGKKSNFSFSIESLVCAGQLILYSN